LNFLHGYEVSFSIGEEIQARGLYAKSPFGGLRRAKVIDLVAALRRSVTAEPEVAA
jgi:hypothetical protein